MKKSTFKQILDKCPDKNSVRVKKDFAGDSWLNTLYGEIKIEAPYLPLELIAKLNADKINSIPHGKLTYNPLSSKPQKYMYIVIQRIRFGLKDTQGQILFDKAYNKYFCWLKEMQCQE